jgi:hypothetical protein
MNLNVFARHKTIPIDKINIYTKYEYKKEDKKIWKKLQKMYLNNKFKAQRNRVLNE